MRSERSVRSGRSGGSEASTATGHVAREVVVPRPSRDELGDAHNDPPPGPGHPGRQAAGSGLDPAGAARARWAAAASQCRVGHGVGVAGGAGHLPHLLACPVVVRGGGGNLPAGQELVGMFAYRLVSGHWRVQTGVARTGEAGTVTTAGVFGLNVLTGWEYRSAQWVDVAWLAMRVHVGRQRKMGVADVIDVEEDEPPTRKRKGRPQGDTPPPPQSPAYGHPGGAGSAGGAGGGAGAEGGGAGVGGPAAGGGVGGTRDQRGGRQPRPRGPSVQGQRGQAGLRVAVGGRHQGA